MTVTAAQPVPAVPPRPSRSQVKDAMPKIPPRPVNRRLDRSISPNPDRFAPSPLNEALLAKSPQPGGQFAPSGLSADPIDRSASVDLPSVGEEGREYDAALAEGLVEPAEQGTTAERTYTVGDNVKLLAPKPKLPAQSAKQRVMAVTRTDSDKAAAYGIGKPSSEEYQGSSSVARSLKKKASTISQLSASESLAEEEHGIPEIGQQVPMYPDAGDVQAPSPAPSAALSEGGRRSKNHHRRTSALGGLPPGSYGLHGHGVIPQDRLEKAYYEKHPDLLVKEHTPHHHDRPNDFSLSRDDLNKIVRETASRGAGLGVSKEYTGTPSEQIGWQVIEEAVHHTPSPGAAARDEGSHTETGRSSVVIEEDGVIHVEEPGRRKSVMFSDDESPAPNEDGAPILAEDEIRNNPPVYDYQPAVELPPERRGSSAAADGDEQQRPVSRTNSRPVSLHKDSSFEIRSTPLEDVEEYKPLFPDEEEKAAAAAASAASLRTKTPQGHTPRFPSRDVWEDAPDSVHYTAELSTPEVLEEEARKKKEEEEEQEQQQSKRKRSLPSREEAETPARLFARHQEELAEQELRAGGADTFIPTHHTHKPIWSQQKHLQHLQQQQRQHQSDPTSTTGPVRPQHSHRFPSRDVWEDTPESHQLQTTVSTPQVEHEAESPAEREQQEQQQQQQQEKPSAVVPPRPAVPARKPTDPSSVSGKPAIPERPKPKTPSPGSEGNKGTTPPPPQAAGATRAPSIPERPKPQIPTRPVKAGPTSGGQEPGEAAAPPRQKPAVPARPVGSKIAALQAGFMSDLNKKLGLGPQAILRKEEPQQPSEDKAGGGEEKVPLSDARKGRAKGPQRRAPAKSPAPTAAAATTEKPSFALSIPQTVFEIDPEAGDVSVGGGAEDKATTESPSAAPAPPLQPPADAAEEAVSSEAEPPTKEGEKGEAAAAPLPPPAEAEKKQEEEPAPTSTTTSTTTEEKTLATNMAGEPVVEGQVEVDEEKQEVEPTDVEEH